MAKSKTIAKNQLTLNDVEVMKALFFQILEKMEAKTMVDPDIKLYSEEETAEKLSISLSTLQNLRKKGKIGYRKLGVRILYSRIDILDFHKSIETRETQKC